jgi:hypothetical protein
VTSISEKPQASYFKPITHKAKSYPELIIKSILEHFTYLKFRNSFRGLIIIILYLLSCGTRHALSVMENMGIMDYTANGIKTKRNIVLLAYIRLFVNHSHKDSIKFFYCNFKECALIDYHVL